MSCRSSSAWKATQGGGDDAFRGRDGPLRVTNPPPRDPIFATMIKAAGEVGIPHNPDYNGASQEGIAMSQATIARGRRMSTARCYLDPIRKRANLHIETDALAEALVLDGRRCTGVRYSVGRRRARGRGRRARSWSAAARSTRRNCWSCRASASPSGCAISASRCARRCPASARICATITRRAPAGWSARRGSPSTIAARGLGMVYQALRYALFRKGLLASVGAPMRAFVCSREGLEAPDLLLGWVPMLTEPGPKGPRISRQSGFTCYAHPMRPESKGHIHIASADPRRPPAINFNFLSSPPDAELTVRAIRIARAVMTAPAMAPLQVTEVAPGADRTTDDEILDWVKTGGGNDLSPGRHLQDGRRPDGGGRCAASRARHRGAAGRRRLDHADLDLGQHQRAVDHDRRKGGGHGAARRRHVTVRAG